MHLVTFENAGKPLLGVLHGQIILNAAAAAEFYSVDGIPGTMQALIAAGPDALAKLAGLLSKAEANPAEMAFWTKLETAKLLAPIPRPTKNIFCVGRNYKAHIEEGARARGVPPTFPTVPEYFSKPPTAVIGPEAVIRLDRRVTQQLDYEVELAIVIGQECRDLSREAAMDVVFGYTIVNDVGARELQRRHGQWLKGKGLDTTCPLGPVIVTQEEFGSPAGKRIGLRVNGETRQDSTTSDLLFDCATIISVLSAGLTLEPGDIIATGTPSGVALGMTPQAWLKDGDIVEAEVEGIGILRNVVREVV